MNEFISNKYKNKLDKMPEKIEEKLKDYFHKDPRGCPEKVDFYMI
jgi:hypothetical protein